MIFNKGQSLSFPAIAAQSLNRQATGSREEPSSQLITLARNPMAADRQRQFFQNGKQGNRRKILGEHGHKTLQETASLTACHGLPANIDIDMPALQCRNHRLGQLLVGCNQRGGAPRCLRTSRMASAIVPASSARVAHSTIDRPASVSRQDWAGLAKTAPIGAERGRRSLASGRGKNPHLEVDPAAFRAQFSGNTSSVSSSSDSWC